MLFFSHQQRILTLIEKKRLDRIYLNVYRLDVTKLYYLYFNPYFNSGSERTLDCKLYWYQKLQTIIVQTFPLLVLNKGKDNFVII